MITIFWLPLGVVGIVSWTIWALRRFGSHWFYRDNSYRCYLTAMAQGWLFRQPLITQVTVMQILCTPLTMGAAIIYLTLWAVQGSLLTFGLAIAVVIVGRTVRGFSHLRENPRDLLIAPLMPLVVALPIKVWAFLSMNKQGWLTRTQVGRVQGQREIAS